MSYLHLIGNLLEKFLNLYKNCLQDQRVEFEPAI